MKVTELITQLQSFLDKHGDHEVWVYDNNCSGEYRCEPWSPLDAADGVRHYVNEHGEYARIETQW